MIDFPESMGWWDFVCIFIRRLYESRKDVFTREFYNIWWGKVRRWYLGKFRKAYVERQLSVRRGHCLQCGRCCNLGIRCPFLTRDNKCSIYNGKRPLQCKLFPIDERDLKDVDYQCGFYFVSEGDVSVGKDCH